jgi:hypothetical protein
MKQNIVTKSIFSLLTLITISVSAMPISSVIPADDSNKVLSTSELVKFQLAKELQITPIAGVVSIKTDAIVLKLTEPSANCSTVACGSASSKDITYEVPLKNVSKDACGVIKYSGFRNLISVDGANTTIEVTDNSHYHCTDLTQPIYRPSTEVQLKIEYFNRAEGKYVDTESLLEGKTLKATMILM